jgi:hypothetical protein
VREERKAAQGLGLVQAQWSRAAESGMSRFIWGTHDGFQDLMKQFTSIFDASKHWGWKHSVDCYALCTGMDIP